MSHIQGTAPPPGNDEDDLSAFETPPQEEEPPSNVDDPNDQSRCTPGVSDTTLLADEDPSPVGATKKDPSPVGATKKVLFGAKSPKSFNISESLEDSAAVSRRQRRQTICPIDSTPSSTTSFDSIAPKDSDATTLRTPAPHSPTHLTPPQGGTIQSTNKQGVSFPIGADIPDQRYTVSLKEEVSPDDSQDSETTKRIKQGRREAQYNVNNKNSTVNRGEQLIRYSKSVAGTGDNVWDHTTPKQTSVKIGGTTACVRSGLDGPTDLTPTSAFALNGIGLFQVFVALDKRYEKDNHWIMLKMDAADQGYEYITGKKHWVVGLIENVVRQIRDQESGGVKPVNSDGFRKCYVPALLIRIRKEDGQIIWISQEGAYRNVKLDGTDLLVEWKNQVLQAFPLEKAGHLVKQNIINGNYRIVPLPAEKKRGKGYGLEKMLRATYEINCTTIVRPIFQACFKSLGEAYKRGNFARTPPGLGKETGLGDEARSRAPFFGMQASAMKKHPTGNDNAQDISFEEEFYEQEMVDRRNGIKEELERFRNGTKDDQDDAQALVLKAVAKSMKCRDELDKERAKDIAESIKRRDELDKEREKNHAESMERRDMIDKERAKDVAESIKRRDELDKERTKDFAESMKRRDDIAKYQAETERLREIEASKERERSASTQALLLQLLVKGSLDPATVAAVGVGLTAADAQEDDEDDEDSPATADTESEDKTELTEKVAPDAKNPFVKGDSVCICAHQELYKSLENRIGQTGTVTRSTTRLIFVKFADDDESKQVRFKCAKKA